MYFKQIQQRFGAAAQNNPYVYIAVCLFASALLLSLFIEIAESAIFENELHVLDAAIIRVVQQFVSPGRTPIIMLVTDSGSAKFYICVFALFCVYWLCRRKWTKLFIFTVCLGGAGVLNMILKGLFERARPDILPVVVETGFSFPSGHAMGALCFYGLTAFFIGLRLKKKRRKYALYLIAALWIACIGVSRIYLGAHYPSDILAGYAAGSAWLFFCISLYYLFIAKKNISRST